MGVEVNASHGNYFPCFLPQVVSISAKSCTFFVPALKKNLIGSVFTQALRLFFLMHECLRYD